MFAFIVRRSVQAVIVMLVISLIAFIIQHNIGDPVREMVGIRVSRAEREVLRDKLGLNDPVTTQYFRFLKNAVRGDLGISYHYKKPAGGVILKKAPATIELVFVSSLIIFFFSFPAGLYTAIRPHTALTKIIMGFSTIGVAVPVFLIAIALIYVFGVELHWLPVYGRGETVNIGGWESGLFTLDGWVHLILPSFSLASIMAPLYIRLIRSEMMEVLEKEYIKFAWAKGLTKGRVWMIHAFKNTLLPVITVAGVEMGILFAFTLLTEAVFQWPGMGFMFLEAVTRADTALIVAYLVVVGAMFVIINTIVDITYGYINPMVRIAGTK